MTAALRSPAATQPLVRIRRAPALDPPADTDRRMDDHPVCAGQLALFTSVQGAGGGHPAGARRAAQRLAALPAEPRPLAAAGSPAPSAPVQVAVSRFVAACVEVLNGFRPVGHLRALTTPIEFDAITTQLTRRTARVRLPSRQQRVNVRRLKVFEQRAGVAEAVAVLHHDETFWAMALRFEHRRGSWLCTLLEVI
jgi:hypothetical protein